MPQHVNGAGPSESVDGLVRQVLEQRLQNFVPDMDERLACQPANAAVHILQRLYQDGDSLGCADSTQDARSVPADVIVWMLERPDESRHSRAPQFFQGLRCCSMQAWETAIYRINQRFGGLTVSLFAQDIGCRYGPGFITRVQHVDEVGERCHIPTPTGCFSCLAKLAVSRSGFVDDQWL